ncbi:hypothetical protein [Phenylobacterium sp.]|uniref:hypothetical protein n=1 Tax=Phenylobacterium sp. TaxID=1871053 RepID=UPI0035B4E8A4
MSAANLAYLTLILAAYAVFMLVLGAVWLRSAFGRKPPAGKMEVTQAKEPAPPKLPTRRAA